MNSNSMSPRVLYSFPHKIGASGICYAAWQHAAYLSSAGVNLTVFPGVHHKPLPDGVRVLPTLSRGKLRLPYKLFGRMGSAMLHDQIVARRLRAMAGQFDLVHCFALGSLETLRVARELGIPSVLERCNAHTRFAYEVVDRECRKLGVTMPRSHPHAFNSRTLEREEAEYAAADFIFCPSEFVAKTFEDQGFSAEKLIRFNYGCEPSLLHPRSAPRQSTGGLKVLFAAHCAPRKGLHYALEAWRNSVASHHGELMIVGEFIPSYEQALKAELSRPGISLLGYRNDLPALMESCDIMVLPSIEEGSALVTYDARAAGCVLLVSDATGAVCQHGHDALIHRCGDVAALTSHFDRLHHDRGFLERLRTNSLATAHELTWQTAGQKMMEAYQTMIQRTAASRQN